MKEVITYKSGKFIFSASYDSQKLNDNCVEKQVAFAKGTNCILNIYAPRRESTKMPIH